MNKEQLNHVFILGGALAMVFGILISIASFFLGTPEYSGLLCGIGFGMILFTGIKQQGFQLEQLRNEEKKV